MSGHTSDRRHEIFNRHADRPLRAEGVPPEEQVSQAKIAEQLETEPEEAENATDRDQDEPEA
ncbi:MAG TPA: hypothetical protein VFJ19_00575 [Nocardioidaceae bacterium]|nr:hypothetical protein [Nocardioidaceae bacterium]